MPPPVFPCHVSPRDMRNHPIRTGEFDDAVTMLGDLGVDQLAPISLRPRKSRFFVGAYEPA